MNPGAPAPGFFCDSQTTVLPGCFVAVKLFGWPRESEPDRQPEKRCR